MRRPNHASRFEGIAKTNLQASRASDTETLQSQVNKAAKKRLSLSGLEILHGRLLTRLPSRRTMPGVLRSVPPILRSAAAILWSIALLCSAPAILWSIALLCSAPAILRLRLGQPNHSVILAL